MKVSIGTGDLLIDKSCLSDPVFLAVTERRKKDLVVRCLRTGLERLMSRAELIELREKRALEVRRVNWRKLPHEWLRMIAVGSDGWPEELRLTAQMRERYCLRVIHLVEREVPLTKACRRAARSVFQRHEGEWRERLIHLRGKAEAASATPRAKPAPVALAPEPIVLAPPGESTLFNWFTRYVASGRDISVLIDRVHDRGNRVPRKENKRHLETEGGGALCVYGAMFSAGREIYLKIPAANKKAAYEAFLTTCKRIGAEPVCRQTFYRFLEANFTAFQHYEAAWGKKEAYYRFGFFNRRELPEKLLEQVEVDHTLLNIWLEDERGNLRRPWLTLFIDRASRCVLGFHLTFDSPSYASVQRALRHSLVAKDVAHFGVRHEWPCHGPFEMVFSDRGSELRCASFRAALELLGTLLISLPGGCPHPRGTIERFFQTVKEALLALPGAFSSTAEYPSDFKPKRGRSLAWFEAWLTKWIVDDYHQRSHSTLKCSPDARWRLLAAQQEMRALPENVRLERLLAYSFTRRARHGAIHRGSKVYWSAELTSAIKRAGHLKRWEVRFSPDSPKVAEVLDDTGPCPLWIPVKVMKAASAKVAAKLIAEARAAEKGLSQEYRDSFTDATAPSPRTDTRAEEEQSLPPISDGRLNSEPPVPSAPGRQFQFQSQPQPQPEPSATPAEEERDSSWLEDLVFQAAA
ncbi:MAG TPA: hypothetical protein VGC56_12030 [Allosphingosinicella sp.]